MSKAEVDAVRDNFSQKDKEGNFSKMWQHSWGEAARKTVLHRARKRLPLSDGAETALRQDEADEFSMETIDNATGESVETRKKQTRAARAVKEAGADNAPAETSAGEPGDGDVMDAEFSDAVESGALDTAAGGGDEPPM
jgi:recombination protein RecT